MRFIRKHKKLVFFLIILLVAGGVAANKFLAEEKPEYVTAKIEKGDLIRTVSVTGSIMSDIITDLHFEVNGKLEKINFAVGDNVKKGDIIAELSASDETIQLQEAQAAFNSAQANLNLKKAGATVEDIKVAETSVNAAEVALKIAKTNLENTKESGAEKIRKAELALENTNVSLISAELDFQNSETNLGNVILTNEQNVDNAYESLKIALDKNLLKIYEYLTQVDEIVGVDDVDANDAFESSLGILKSTTFDSAQMAYTAAKKDYDDVNDEFLLLGEEKKSDKIKEISDVMIQALYSLDNSLLKTRILLNNSVVSGNLTETMLSNFKSTIDTARIGANTEVGITQTKKQLLVSAEINKKSNIDAAQASYDSASSNYNKAVSARDISEQSLSSTKIDAENSTNNASLEIEAKEKSLETAKASYNLKKAPPRQIDVASLEAQVSQASASLSLAQENLGKTKLTAPSDGLITNLDKELGENITISGKFATMISPQLIIEADVSETDISKIEIGQKIDVTFDAFGEEEKFLGEIIFIDPAETKIQDVIYYRIKVVIRDRKGNSIRSGMTVNLDILTGQKSDVLLVPVRAIIENNGEKLLRILTATGIREIRIQTGIRGDGGVIEIVSGAKEGQEIVVSVR
ncbi:efflux RND transporter periplasmic adaptor subunit [Candidatus Falkowbacteria bacterium]|jgi:RND family efflux transporter MFP subunit|nr:efflux RND transporter periplasmic adaptor subunit [Candidatus Falkowbacteria bacterium]MBT4433285.1 efflux RND transporter periplasmic adaptor subunit [Candidatus Falkowbacteria bacterium]